MRLLKRILFKFRSLAHRRRRETELRDEMQFHLEQQAALLRAEGMSADDARREAIIEFGGLDTAIEGCRDEWGVGMWEGFVQDLRFAIRIFRRTPALTITAVLIIAGGIGATTTMFGLIDAALLRAVPLPEAERVVAIAQTSAKSGSQAGEAAPANFLDWRERARSFDRMAAVVPYGFDMVRPDGRPETIQAGLTTEGFFELTGIQPTLGRTFVAQEHQAGHDRVVVLSEALWMGRFGGDPAIVGRTLLFDREPHTVIGVVESTMQLLSFPRTQLAWRPKVITADDQKERGTGYIRVFGKLRDGVSRAAAQSEMEAISAQLRREHPNDNEGVGVALMSLERHLGQSVREPLTLLFAAVVLLLALACANVGNLLFSRNVTRWRELSVRTALGATRARLQRQLLTESLLVSALGCMLGVLCAWWSFKLFRNSVIAASFPRAGEVGLNWTAVTVSIAAMLIAALLAGVMSAWRITQAGVGERLKETMANGSIQRGRMRQFAVGVQIAGAAVLLITAGLLLRSFVQITSVDPGYTKSNLVAVQAFIWDRQEGAGKRAAFVRDTVARLERLPGVEAAAGASMPPLLESAIDMKAKFSLPGFAEDNLRGQQSAYLNIVTDGYFSTMRMPMLAGREFGAPDTAESLPVLVINQTLARQHWPAGDAVGKRITLRFGGTKEREIVGVVADSRQFALDAPPRPEILLPHKQYPFGSVTFVVRSSPGTRLEVGTVQRAIWELDAGLPFYASTTVEELIESTIAGRRFQAHLLGCFGLAALLLAVLGVYGLVSFGVQQRMKEIGVRVALGATGTQIVRPLLSEALATVIPSTLLGVAGGTLAGFAGRKLLFGIAPADGMTIAVVVCLLVSGAFLATLLPTRRALQISPMEALRSE